MIDTQPQQRLISSEVIAYNELTTRLHLHHKPVRECKTTWRLFAFCQMMGLVIRFCSSITTLYSFLSFIMVYIHTQIYSGRKLQSCLSFCSLSVHGECFPQKRRAYGSKVKVLCCEISLQYSFILYIWCRHLSHLLGLSHLQVLSLSSSWRSLQYSSVCLQEHRQVAGSCTNKRFLLSEQ